MDSLTDGNVAGPLLKHGSSFTSSLMDGSPPTSGFPSTDFEGHHHHLQAPQGPWRSMPAAQMSTLQFSFAEDQGDTRRLLPTFFAGGDGYGNLQFGSPPAGSSTWDNKLSYMSSAASSGMAGNSMGITGHGQMQTGLPQVNVGNPLGITGHGPIQAGLVHGSMGQGHSNMGRDYVHSILEHMHAGQAHINGEVSSRKMLMLPQSWVPLNVNTAMDPSSEGLTAQGVNLTVPHGLPSLPSDPGFADRAARFSPFGNMGYSESHLAGDSGKDLNKAKLNVIRPVGQFGFTKRSAPSSPNGFNNDNGGCPVEASSAAPTSAAVAMEESIKGLETRTSFPPSANMIVEGDEAAQKQFCASVNESDESMGQEVSSSCGAAPMQGLSENSGRKRKAVSQKLKDGGGHTTSPKDLDPDDGRPKCQGGSDNIFDKSLKPQEQSNSGNSEESTPKSAKEISKPPEPPKPDYIHVRARRGQATDSHSLAERVRREKISERMKFLQDLVPGCSKVTGKAVMLDEIINYVQSLQRQVEFLSMKLAAVNPRVEFSIDNLFSRERPVQPRVATPASVFGLQNPSMYPPFQPHQQPQVPIRPLDQCPPLEVPSFGSDPALRRTMSTPPSMEAYGGGPASQASQAWDNELQSVVEMSFAQQQPALDLPGSTFQGQMKVEH